MTAPERRDKTSTLDAVVSELTDGMTIGIGGWGSRRKPMAALRALLRSPLRELTVVSYGGPDVGLLCAAGKVRRVVYGFVSLDSIPYDPWFSRARTTGSIEVREVDEGMLNAGLQAAAARLPFLPIRAGIGSDVMAYYPELRTIRSPYPIPGTDQFEELVAMPALTLDAAFVHLNLADASGNGVYLGPDPYFDDLYLRAATRRYLTCERIVPTAELVAAAPPQAMLTNRMMVDAVIAAPAGAHFTSCVPDYDRDEAFQKAYVAAAADDAEWAKFYDNYVSGTDRQDVDA
ncbi:CoA transferase subunit A [Rhodococcoides yunnanense]|mgnify:FL=1|jgi:glutaconate CoA-transferase subunit A|uniref:CoA transferase subunit A n=1 Tax=Rhodococcoides yunnanense TaxID=278209 RepID=UPI0022B1CFF2|nr:CoA-transferase [Rhodococcus yunnanensis]MCZ4275410.1 acyl CoA--acetate/3-ketoacid CoA transferase subunit alpha [Rhodococcus yunnanensis]